MATEHERVARATGYGAQAVLVEIVELLARQYEIEARQSAIARAAVKGNPGELYSGGRVDALSDLAANVQSLAVELKLEVPPKLLAITNVARAAYEPPHLRELSADEAARKVGGR